MYLDIDLYRYSVGVMLCYGVCYVSRVPARDTLREVFYNIQPDRMSGLPASLSRSTGRGSGGSRGAGAGRVGASPRGEGRGTSTLPALAARHAPSSVLLDALLVRLNAL